VPHDGYTRAELEQLPDEAWPVRGPRCERCGTVIPIFVDATDRALKRIRKRAVRDPSGAMAELRDATGCPERMAKIWVVQ